MRNPFQGLENFGRSVGEFFSHRNRLGHKIFKGCNLIGKPYPKRFHGSDGFAKHRNFLCFVGPYDISKGMKQWVDAKEFYFRMTENGALRGNHNVAHGYKI
ncbi:MAG: hypothetical protein A4E72_01768 [Syntrophus sp. PtaU1.Bin208]|nr:MAG: hypothetical protein A4E72_01768 [Syntrophus sp. PtaU1.Bin208]